MNEAGTATVADPFLEGFRCEAQFASENAQHYTAQQWTWRAEYLDSEIDETNAEIARLREAATALCGRRLVAGIKARITGQEEEEL